MEGIIIDSTLSWSIKDVAMIAPDKMTLKIETLT